MHVAAEHMQHLDDIIDIIVEGRNGPRPKGTMRAIGPVGDVDFMGRQERLDGGRAAALRSGRTSAPTDQQPADAGYAAGRVSLRSKYNRRQNGFSQIAAGFRPGVAHAV